MHKEQEGTKDKAYNIHFITRKKQILASSVISPFSNANLGNQQRTMIITSRTFFSPPANITFGSITLIRGTESARNIERERLTIS